MQPDLFYGPDQSIWATLVPYDPDKDLETYAPLFDREDYKPLRPGRQSVLKYIGSINDHSVFYDVDLWSDMKPDKMMVLEYKNGSIKKKHNFKITPRDNITFIVNNQFHLLAKDGEEMLHRLLDEKSNVIRSRRLRRL